MNRSPNDFYLDHCSPFPELSPRFDMRLHFAASSIARVNMPRCTVSALLSPMIRSKYNVRHWKNGSTSTVDGRLYLIGYRCYVSPKMLPALSVWIMRETIGSPCVVAMSITVHAWGNAHRFNTTKACPHGKYHVRNAGEDLR
jgi:hypothetical protein